ncbi:MAG: GNAT family N-acetyltransferase, partial [Cellulosilyticaceae bacterium]
MTFRQAQTIDAREVMTIIEEAQAYFKGAGIDQWQNGYPNLEVIEADIQKGKSYVLVRDGQIVASAALSFNDERTYDKIYEGRWLSEGSYGVIHRIAVKDTCKGCGVAGM